MVKMALINRDRNGLANRLIAAGVINDFDLSQRARVSRESIPLVDTK